MSDGREVPTSLCSMVSAALFLIPGTCMMQKRQRLLEVPEVWVGYVVECPVTKKFQ